MMRTTARWVAALLAAVMAVAIAPVASGASPEDTGAPPAPEPRAIQAFALDMVEGGGTLTLRGADPRAIETPTRVTGTVDAADPDDPEDVGTGAITDGTFTTPTISFETEITDPITATVYVDATFTLVEPGNLSGTVDSDGNVSLQMRLGADLDIDVGRPPLLSGVCRSAPIVLNLTSTAPYDPDTGRVTVATNNFSAPPVPATPQCDQTLANGVNDLLAGSGHAISLTLQGDLPLPAAEREPTVTTLSVAPDAATDLGEPVTLSATVAAAEDAAVEGEPEGGLVEFRDDGTVIASVTLEDDGTAELVTETLPAGTRELTAAYRGDTVFGPSTSAPVDHTVIANPALVGSLPPTVTITGPARTIEVEATNTGFGTDLENVRVDVTLRRAAGAARPGGGGTSAPIGPVTVDGQPQPRITLGVVEGEAVTPVPLVHQGTGSNQTLSGSVGATTGVPLATAEALVRTLRIQLPDVGPPPTAGCQPSERLCPGTLQITFDLQLVDPGTGDVVRTLASESSVTTMVEPQRRAVTIAAGSPGFPPVFPTMPPVAPHTVRAGNDMELTSLRLANIHATAAAPEGAYRVLVGGHPAQLVNPWTFQLVDELSVADATTARVAVPPEVPPGTHDVRVLFSGDRFYAPAEAVYTVTVAPAAGPRYECRLPGLNVNYVGHVQVDARGSLPAAAAGGAEVSVDSPSLALLIDRGPTASVLPVFDATGRFPAIAANLEGVEIAYSVQGASTVGGLTLVNETKMLDASGPIDQILTFEDLATTLTVAGEPGEVLSIDIDSITFHFRNNSAHPVETKTCVPVDEPASLGSVTVAGTTLEVAPEGVAREGAPVTLSARAVPSARGVMEFRADGSTVGVVPVGIEGTATLVTRRLPVGDLSITARYLGGLTAPSTVSEPVALRVEATQCAEFATPGHPAVVRLVYLSLLGRCPDQAGFDHWVERLEGGTSRAVFARTISNTPEAQGRLVDRAYRMVLNRAPDAGGRAHWVGQLQRGYRYDRLLSALAGEPEFFQLAGSTNPGFVTRLYERVLLRSPDQGGLDHWVGELERGVPRWRVAQAFTYVDETLGRLATGAFGDMLDRTPDADERTEAIGFLRRTGNLAGLYGQLIDRPEFVTRAQTYPNVTLT